MIIRDATPADAKQACQVLRDSIVELCSADHRDDPVILSRWLANKTPDNVAAWAVASGRALLVAVEDGAILAVGGLTHAGEITANYVAPAARFRGVSSAMLAALEQRAAAHGAASCTLLSTETAHRFYLARGYRDEGPSVGKFGTAASYSMVKPLRVQE
ncbi:GNAT family N-acetyltransferase [Bradyrhizobium sp. STM 3557]|uniref:GNAT family N-acetyltransferase n=1 Tax=Bradyrhizobium sp. STM 3557 TaxID=578920 RepID=UPI00388FFACA